MSLSKVTLICDLADGQGNYLTQGTGYFAPTAVLTDSTDHLVAGTQPAIPVAFHAGAGPPQVELIACDNAGILPAPGGWAWTFTPPSVTGIAPFSFFLDYADGATQYLSDQIPVSAPSGLQAWMPLPAGTPAAGQVPEATGVGQASEWGSGGGGGAVTSVNGQTGVVVLTAADVDADASGAAATAQSNAETYAAGQASAAQSAAETFATDAVAAETSRAETAEALKATLASPALTGTPTAPTASALADSTQVATTAYADAAVGVETSRAESAEALKLAKASNLSDLASAATARTNLGLGTAATQASSAFDAAGAATTAQAAAEAASIPAGTIISGQFLAAPKVYAPAAQTLLSVTTTTMAAWDSGVVCTGSFTAPPSGEVLVTASFVLMVAAAGWVAVGLAATGTVTPVIGNLVQIEVSTTAMRLPLDVRIPVTGLTPGTVYNLDLLGAVSSGANPAQIEAFGVSTTTPGLAGTSVGAPVIMTVQGV